jgi:serine/threonine protein kinase
MNDAAPTPPMPDARHCPQCGTPLPTGALAGLCPACLLQQGAAADTATDGKQPQFVPPTVEEIAQLFPQLEILGLLGKGGMGAVYKARQPALDRFVALKILPAAAGSEAGFAERFAREARALARLSHPHIVTLYEFGSSGREFAQAASAGEESRLTSAAAGQLYYFLMEFVDGVNLRQLQRSGRLGPREALQIVPQICDALQYAHDEGVVHRDIKPENVLVDRKGRVKIADFGLAKLVGTDGRADLPVSQAPEAAQQRRPTEDLTRAGQVMGTPNYMAPEQADNPQDVDHRADIYALGVVFYEMLTGELPLGQFPPPSRKVRIDVRLDEVVLHALEKTPERRYQQASQVKSDVETITADAAKAAVPSPKSAAEARLEDMNRRYQKQLWYGFIVSLIGLPIGIALKLPFVWGLAVVGVVLGAWKLGLLSRTRAGGASEKPPEQATSAVAPPRPLREWERRWQAVPQTWRRLMCAGLGLAALVLLVGFLWPQREVVTAPPLVTDTWTFGWGAPWWKEVKVLAPSQQNWRELHALTGSFAAGLAGLALLLGLGALLNAERGTSGFLLQVVDWPGGQRRVHWGRGLLVMGFFLLLVTNLAALTNALLFVTLRDAPPLLLLIFILPGFMLAPVLRLLAVTYLRHSPPQASANPTAPPPPLPERSGSRLARAAVVALVVFVLVTLTATVVTFLLPESYEGVTRGSGLSERRRATAPRRRLSEPLRSILHPDRVRGDPVAGDPRARDPGAGIERCLGQDLQRWDAAFGRAGP